MQLAQVDERLAFLTELHRLVGRIRVDHAPRGLGKTSRLRQAQRIGEDRGALTLWVTAGGVRSGGPRLLRLAQRPVRGIAREIERKTKD